MYLHSTPDLPLASFVDILWYYEGRAAPHTKERLLPDGSMELVINLREDLIRIYDRQNPDHSTSYHGSLFCGPHTQFSIIDTESQASVIGIHFRPGGAFPFLGFPAGELNDIDVPLETLWGAHASELRDRLITAEHPQAKIALLAEALLARITHLPTRHPAVTFALKELSASPSRSLATITDQLGLSPRRFSQVFQDEVGLTPKRYQRIQRFQDVLRLIACQQSIDWTQTALHCGYFDQAHFIHDFRAFSGMSPRSYLQQRSEHLNHVPLVERR